MMTVQGEDPEPWTYPPLQAHTPTIWAPFGDNLLIARVLQSGILFAVVQGSL